MTLGESLHLSGLGLPFLEGDEAALGDSYGLTKLSFWGMEIIAAGRETHICVNFLFKAFSDFPQGQ